MQFESIKEAFSRMPPGGDNFHRLVIFCIFVQTNRNIGGVGVFDDVRIFSVGKKNVFQNLQTQNGTFVDINHECFVTAFQNIPEVIPERFLGGSSARLSVESQRDCVDDRDG